jgi:cyclic patellamide precursor peptide PatG
VPHDSQDLDLLIEAVRAKPQATDLDVVIGIRGPIASPEICNGLMVPIMVFDQLYSFDRNLFLDAIPRPESAPEGENERFEATAGELFDRVMQMADNAGATDEHRALNYLSVRYPAIYARTVEAYAGEFSFTGWRVVILA